MRYGPPELRITQKSGRQVAVRREGEWPRMELPTRCELLRRQARDTKLSQGLDPHPLRKSAPAPARSSVQSYLAVGTVRSRAARRHADGRGRPAQGVDLNSAQLLNNGMLHALAAFSRTKRHERGPLRRLVLMGIGTSRHQGTE